MANPVELTQMIDRLAAINVRCAAFYEPDDDLGLTAICTEPISDQRRRFFRHYPLWSAAIGGRGPPSRCFVMPPIEQHPAG